MITNKTFREALSFRVAGNSTGMGGLSRMFSTAVSNRQFCDTLLKDPEAALAMGYQGEAFGLSPEEQNLVVSIQAKSLPDLAKQVNRALKNGI